MKEKTIIYSVRLDPRVVATLGRVYDLREVQFRSASQLIRDALDIYTELMVSIATEEKGVDPSSIRPETFYDALSHLNNDIRLTTKQSYEAVEKLGGKLRDLKKEFHSLKRIEKEKKVITEAVVTGPVEDSRAQELINAGKEIREELEDEKVKGS